MDGNDKNERSRSGPLAFVREWVAPVAFAGAFALVIAGTVEFIDRSDRSDRSDRNAAKAGKEAPDMQTQLSSRSAPRFVVAIRRSGTAVVVRDLLSGKVVDDTMPPPPGRRFQQVAAASNGTYIVSGQGQGRVVFYRLRLTAKGHAAEFTALPRALSGASTPWSDMAVSADGTRVGYVTYRGPIGRIDVLSLTSGARRTWTTRSRGRIGSLSWAGDALSYVWAPLGPSGRFGTRQVRVLDTGGAPGDLSASRLVLALPKGSEAAVLGRDGRTVVTGVNDHAGLALTAFSVGDGRRTRVLRRYAGATGLVRLVADGTREHLLATSGDGHVYADSSGDVRAAVGTDDADVAW